MKTEQLSDKDFGIIILHRRVSARNIIFRVKQGQLHISLPTRTTLKTLKEILDKKRPQLSRLFSRKNEQYLKPGDIIYMHDFIVCISGECESRYRSRFADNTLHIVLPKLDNYNDEQVQQNIARLIRPHLRRAAEEYLPKRLEYWAQITGNQYQGVVISHGRHRLGVCRSDRRISLSYYLMCLPDRLIDYVILHELAHLNEMNHSARFHEICNRYCQGKESSLRKELRQFPFPIE